MCVHICVYVPSTYIEDVLMFLWIYWTWVPMCKYTRTRTKTTGLRAIRFFLACVCVCVCGGGGGGGLPEGTCGISSCTGGYGGWPAARSHLCPPGQSAASRGCHCRSHSGCTPAPLPLSSHSEKKYRGMVLSSLVLVDGWLKGRRKNRGDMRKRAFE